MTNLNPQILLMGWLFAKNTFWVQPSDSEPDNFSGYLTDLNGVLLKTSDNFYLIPKMEA